MQTSLYSHQPSALPATIKHCRYMYISCTVEYRHSIYYILTHVRTVLKLVPVTSTMEKSSKNMSAHTNAHTTVALEEGYIEFHDKELT